MTFRIKIRLISWLALVLVTGGLLYMGIVPSGKVTYSSDFDNPGYFIRKLTPEERVLAPINGEQAVVGDPAYFAVRTPRAFARAKVTVTYKNPDNIPIIEAGVLADRKVWRYQTKPLANRHLDELAAKWPAIRQDRMLLLQQEKEFESIEDFLGHLPHAQSVAVYNFGLSVPFRIADYRPATTTTVFNLPVRGAYQFYTYIKNEPLVFSLLLKDLNLNKDADPAELKLWQGSNLLATAKLPDDGVTGDTGTVGAERELKLEAVALPEAAYRLELVANDDLVTSRIATPQTKLAFINKVWFAESAKTPVTLDTDSQAINVQTFNPAKLSSVTVGQQRLDVAETYRQYSATADGRMTRLVLPQDDMIVSGDGVFAVTADSFVDPSFIKVGPHFDPERRSIKYVIADYQPPRTDQDGWLTAEAEFDLGSSAYREFYKYSFMISAPGLKAEEEPQRKLILKEVSIEFSGSGLWEKIMDRFYGK